MNRKKALAALVLTLVSAMLIGMTMNADSPRPDGEFFAQALKSQEQLCDPSLSVTYTLSTNGREEQCKYVRTREMQFLERISQSREIRNSLDRESRTSVQVIIATDGSSSEAVIDGERVGNRVFPDIALFPLDATTLPELLSRGSVHREKEDIGSVSCWRVDIPSKHMPGETYSVWLDPDRGCCPRRIVISRPNRLPQTIDFLSYENMGDGVWFPMEIRNRFHFVLTAGEATAADERDEMMEVRMNIEKVEIRKDIPKADLTVPIPSGARVYDRVSKAEYIKP